jgi:hypothetical protein
MTKQQVMCLMMRSDRRTLDADLYTVSALLADRLARISHKLDRAEMDAFIEIGAAVYAEGLARFGAHVPVEDLFPVGEDWAMGPQPRRSGFRRT